MLAHPGSHQAQAPPPPLPLQWVMVSVQTDRPMCFGGTEEPCAFGELISIGAIGGEKNKAISEQHSPISLRPAHSAQQPARPHSLRLHTGCLPACLRCPLQALPLPLCCSRSSRSRPGAST